VNIPSFTAENSIYKSKGRYCMAAAFGSQNTSANVQPAIRYRHCERFMHAFTNAIQNDDWLEATFWINAWDGAGCAEIY
jgi:hypothetical protein